MHGYRRSLLICVLLTFCWLNSGSTATAQETLPLTDKVTDILVRVAPPLTKELNDKGFQLGAPLFIRIFKLPGKLEVWLGRGGRYELFKSYPICDFSGFPGPKQHEGDWQSPEGFYSVSPGQMNPRSRYHLSFNIGYPNEYDILRNRSGSNIMVHGNCSSMGCFAMSDYRMEEIYTLAHTALANGQRSFSVHIFPFPLTEVNMQKFRASPWISFWQNLKEGYDAFEQTRQVPQIQVTGGRYVVSDLSRLAMRNKKR